MIRNLFAGIGCLTVLVILGLVAWYFREDIEAWMNARNLVVMTEPSEELAAQAERKIEDMRAGVGPEETRLSEVEIQSYLRYRLVDRLPAGVTNPAIDLLDSTASVSADLDFESLEYEGMAVAMLQGIMGDSTLLSGELYPGIASPGVGRVQVLSLTAGIATVPPPLMGMAVAQFGLRADGSAVLFDLAPGITGFRIEDEELILERRP